MRESASKLKIISVNVSEFWRVEQTDGLSHE